MALPLGNGSNAPPSNEDIAKVIVGALSNPTAYIRKSVRPTGPKLLSPDDIAAAFAKVLGRKVRYQNAPIKLFLKFGKSIGLSDFILTQLYFFLLDYQRGSFGMGAPTNAVLEVGGTPPEDFETIVRRYVAQSPYAKRSLGLTVQAIGNLAKAMLAPAPNIETLAQKLNIPSIASGSLGRRFGKLARLARTAGKN